MLWLDMTVSVTDAEQSTAFDETFDVHRLRVPASIDSEIERLKPDVVSFDFDFPTKHGLKTLQETKQRHSSVPMIMLTVQHSEALAVWAFRSRVWDYFVKPIPQREIDRCLGSLLEMLALRGTQNVERRAAIPVSTIPEENRVRGPRGQGPLTLAPAVSYVESNYREKVSAAQAAERCRLSPFQFSRLFKETYGLTFQEYLLRFRIREACRLLRNPNAQVADVAHLVGFSDPSYFGKVFRRYTNLSPSRFAGASTSVLDPEDLLETLGAD